MLLWESFGGPILFRAVEYLVGFFGGGLLYFIDLVIAIGSTAVWYVGQINFIALHQRLLYAMRDIPTALGYCLGLSFRSVVGGMSETVRLYKALVHGVNKHTVARLYKPTTIENKQAIRGIKQLIRTHRLPNVSTIPTTLVEYIAYGIK